MEVDSFLNDFIGCYPGAWQILNEASPGFLWNFLTKKGRLSKPPGHLPPIHSRHDGKLAVILGGEYAFPWQRNLTAIRHCEERPEGATWQSQRKANHMASLRGATAGSDVAISRKSNFQHNTKMFPGSSFIQGIPTSSFLRRTPRNDGRKNWWRHSSEWRHWAMLPDTSLWGVLPILLEGRRDNLRGWGRYV